MKRETNSPEWPPFNQAAQEIGLILNQSSNIAELREIKTPYGLLKRIREPRSRTEIPPEYQHKKHLFWAEIQDRPVVILHFSGEIYGQDEDYFRRIYQNSKDVFGGQATQFTERKITPSLLGFNDKTMTLIVERGLHDLSFYFASPDENEVRRIVKGCITLMQHVWEKSKKENDEFPRYFTAFLEPEYPFLKGKRVKDYLKDQRVIKLYLQTQAALRKYLGELNQSGFERGFGFSDVKSANLVEDEQGNILFIDAGKPGLLHWLSMLGQLYQDTITKAPNTLFSQVLKQEISQQLNSDPQPELALKLFAIGRTNRLLIGCTLRNIVFTAEIGKLIDENTIRDTLAKVRHLMEVISPEEVIKYASDEFESNWRERLRNYPQTLEFQENLRRLKEKADKTLPQEKPPRKLIFVFMGIAGSGKSTIAEIIKKLHPGVILRSDWIFFEKLRDQIEDDYYKAYAYQEELARRYLQEGYSVIMDDNNRTIKNRSEVYKWAKEFDAEPILIKIEVSPEVVTERVTLKGGEIKTKDEILHGLIAFQSQMEEPTDEEKRTIPIFRIDGSQTLEEITTQLKRELSRI